MGKGRIVLIKCFDVGWGWGMTEAGQFLSFQQLLIFMCHFFKHFLFYPFLILFLFISLPVTYSQFSWNQNLNHLELQVLFPLEQVLL